MAKNSKKRILIFSLTYFPKFVGGAEVAMRELTSRLSDYEFHMITLRFDSSLLEEERIDNTVVHRVGFSRALGEGSAIDATFKLPLSINKYLFPFFALRKALSLHKYLHFGATISVMAGYAGFGALFFKVFRPEVPFLLNMQEGDPPEYIKHRVRMVRPLFDGIFRRADFIQTISNYLADFAREMGANCPVEVVPNGVDLKHFDISVSRAERARTRQELGVGDDDICLVTTSRLVKKNGTEFTIKALAKMPEHYKLLILGEGPLRSSLELLADSLGLGRRVIFYGSVDQTELPRCYKASDIFIRPSLSEGMGVSFIEAFSAKIPVVATRVGGIADFLKDGQTGFACLPEDSDSIVERLDYMAKNPRLVEDVVIHAHALVREKYDWGIVSERMKSIITQLVKNGQKHNSLKILLTTGVYPPDLGGPAEYVKNLEHEFGQLGHAVTVKTYGLEKKLPTGIRHLYFLLRILPSLARADVVYTFDTFSAALPTVFAGIFLLKRVIIRTGGDFLWEKVANSSSEVVPFGDFYEKYLPRLSRFERIIFSLTKFTLHYAHAIIFSTQWQQDIFAKHYELRSYKLHLVENCYMPKQDSVSASSKVFIGSTRRIGLKNLLRLERAFGRATGKPPSAVLFTDSLSHHELMVKMRECYAVVLVSFGEISPNLILEAIRFDRPFICTREVGIYERIKSCGIYVDPHSDVEITMAIERLLDPVQYEHEKEKVRAFNFVHSYREIAREFLDIVE